MFRHKRQLYSWKLQELRVWGNSGDTSNKDWPNCLAGDILMLPSSNHVNVLNSMWPFEIHLFRPFSRTRLKNLYAKCKLQIPGMLVSVPQIWLGPVVQHTLATWFSQWLPWFSQHPAEVQFAQGTCVQDAEEPKTPSQFEFSREHFRDECCFDVAGLVQGAAKPVFNCKAKWLMLRLCHACENMLLL